MYLNDLLTEKGMSKYRLSKESGIPQTTIVDICSGKSRIEKCSADTIYRIAKTLNVSMESLIEQEMERCTQMSKRSDFEVFKSNVCHLVKDKGDIEFIRMVQEYNMLESFFADNKEKEGFYLLGMVDHLCKVNGIPNIERFDKYRNSKLKNIIYPRGILILSLLSEPGAKERALKHAIPEFLKYNIVEENVRDVH